MTDREHGLATTALVCGSTVVIVAVVSGAVCFVSATTALAVSALAAGSAVAGFAGGILAAASAYGVVWMARGREAIVPLRRYRFVDGLRVVVTRVGVLSVSYHAVLPDGSVTPECTSPLGAFRRAAVAYETDPGTDRPHLVVHGGGR